MRKSAGNVFLLQSVLRTLFIACYDRLTDVRSAMKQKKQFTRSYVFADILTYLSELVISIRVSDIYPVQSHLRSPGRVHRQETQDDA